MLSLGQNCIYFNLFFKKQTHSCFDTTHQLFFTKNAEKLSKSLFTDRPLALNWVLCCVYLRSWETLAAAAGSTRRDTRWAEPSAQWEMPVSRPQFSTQYTLLWKSVLPTFPQCGNLMIFLSLRFYVKSILENLRVLKLPHCETLKCVLFEKSPKIS